ncbi:hypothetical protein Trydic_g22984 [Trypoxylus dichotomus]
MELELHGLSADNKAAKAGNCEFGENLNERLRDQLVIGINNSAWQQELIRVHPSNAATLEEIEASVIILEQPTLQSKHLPIPVPLALQQQVTAELDRLVMEDVLEPVNLNTDPIEWATPIVLAVKSNGSIRICGDFSVTINPYVRKDDYPLPRFEDITAKLRGGQYFSKLDLKDVYLQLQVHPESRKLFVISTHRGYYQYKTLPFDVNFALSLFQRTMDQILSGIEGTKNVSFLGHDIDAEGLHPAIEHIAAIEKVAGPTNVNELRSFFG